MTHPTQTLDSALAAIAAEREALKFGQAGALSHVPSSTVSTTLPPIPRAPGLVNQLPTHLQSVTRVDVPMVSTPLPTAKTVIRKSSNKAVMILGNVALSAVVSAGSVFGLNMLSTVSSVDTPALVKTSLGVAAGKQDKFSAKQSAKIAKSCTAISQDLMTGRVKSSSCRDSFGNVASVEVTQFSSQSTSATVNNKKFIESLSTSNDKIAGSLSERVKTVTIASENQFAQTAPMTETLGDSGMEFQLKPRGIVKKFYAPSN